MSQGFKLKFDEMLENNPAKQESSIKLDESAYDELYADEGNARYISFVQLNGKRIFLNYSYLIACEYDPEQNTIYLIYTTHKIVMKGVNLETLYYKIMEQHIRQIVCSDPRYNVVGKDLQSIVNAINITKE